MRLLLALLYLSSAAPAADEPRIRVDVNLVNVAFSVHNAHGKLAADLSKDDFEVLEDGVPQRVSFFARSLDVPLSLGLVADVSGSQQSFNEGHLHDMKEFLKDVLAPRYQAFLVCFGRRMQLVGDFTASGKSLMDAFERFEHGGDRYPLGASTALFDAVYYAVTAKLAVVEGGGRALILFSDGLNNASTHDIADTIQAAQTADTRIFTMRYAWFPRNGASIRLKDLIAARQMVGANVMERIARETGGTDFDAAQGNVRAIFRQIANELRASYELAYVSTNTVRDGSFRKIAIRPRRAGLGARAKAGYLAR